MICCDLMIATRRMFLRRPWIRSCGGRLPIRSGKVLGSHADLANSYVTAKRTEMDKS